MTEACWSNVVNFFQLGQSSLTHSKLTMKIMRENKKYREAMSNMLEVCKQISEIEKRNYEYHVETKSPFFYRAFDWMFYASISIMFSIRILSIEFLFAMSQWGDRMTNFILLFVILKNSSILDFQFECIWSLRQFIFKLMKFDDFNGDVTFCQRIEFAKIIPVPHRRTNEFPKHTLDHCTNTKKKRMCSFTIAHLCVRVAMCWLLNHSLVMQYFQLETANIFLKFCSNLLVKKWNWVEREFDAICLRVIIVFALIWRSKRRMCVRSVRIKLGSFKLFINGKHYFYIIWAKYIRRFFLLGIK